MLIIADDITGAAEIAGIAWRKGLKVNLRLSGHKVATLSGNEDLKTSKPQNLKTSITVIATDTRSGTEEEAVKTIEDLFAPSTSPLQGGVGGGLIFKKTDSVLRGHVAAELQALMRVTGKQKALLIPQNPSKGRIVKDGIYYINGTPLDQTSFAYDPEFPAKTAEAKKLLKRSAGVQEFRSSDNSWTSKLSSPSSHLSSISSPKGEDGRGLLLPDATTLEEIREHVAKADHNTLFAGGADMFEAVVDYLLGDGAPLTAPEGASILNGILRSEGVKELRSEDNSAPSKPPRGEASEIPMHAAIVSPSGDEGGASGASRGAKILILCGSTQSRSLIGEPFFANKNAIEVTMPEDVFHGTASIPETNAWIATLKDHWQNHDAMIVRIGHEATGGKEYAVRLRKLFGEMAYQILSPDQGVQECRSSDDSLSSNPSSLIPHLSSQFRSEGVQTLPGQGVQECRSTGVQTLPSSTSNLSTCQLKQATCQLVNSSTCQLAKHSTRIILEGGATAYTVLERLGISSFDVEYEYSPGVVCLSHGNMRIILKPGSYPWGNLFEEL
ncbi:MAG: hypothetical protein J6A02_11495 [Prevotella sp.]|nr:hypothetical protein [Prevotella sp.]